MSTMPRMNEDLLGRFLAEPHIGVLASLRRNGMPYTVPVWFIWHEGGFWMTGTTTRVWCRQLLADPRASLCIEATRPEPGHVGVDGEVSAHLPDEFDIWPISRLLAEKYVGRNDPANAAAVERFVANMRTEPRMLFCLHPQTERRNAIRAIDMSVYEGKRGDRQHQAENR